MYDCLTYLQRKEYFHKVRNKVLPNRQCFAVLSFMAVVISITLIIHLTAALTQLPNKAKHYCILCFKIWEKHETQSSEMYMHRWQTQPILKSLDRLVASTATIATCALCSRSWGSEVGIGRESALSLACNLEFNCAAIACVREREREKASQAYLAWLAHSLSLFTTSTIAYNTVSPQSTKQLCRICLVNTTVRLFYNVAKKPDKPKPKSLHRERSINSEL